MPFIVISSADAVNADLVAAADEQRHRPLDYKPGEIFGYLQRRGQRTPKGAYKNPQEAALWVFSHLNEDGKLEAEEIPREITWQEVRWIFRERELQERRLVQSGCALTADTHMRVIRGSGDLGSISATREGVLVTPVGDTPGIRHQWWLDGLGPNILEPRNTGAVYEIESTATRLRLEQISKPYWAVEMGRERNGLFMRFDGPKRWIWFPPEGYLDTVRETRGCWVSQSGFVDRKASTMKEISPALVWDDEYGLYQDVTIHGTPQRFRWIPPGEFLMGSPENEPERSSDETQHEVELTKGFWMADTACTQALWQAVMGENPSDFKGDDRPVENVSWDDCRTFFERANKENPHLNLRFPTEPEWEYACRAGTSTPFSFGENVNTDQVNFCGTGPYAGGPEGKFREETVDVKTLSPNGWGLYEMHGNVDEWCADWFGEYTSGKVVDPKGPEKGVNRVLRGGSWFDYGGYCRSAYRL